MKTKRDIVSDGCSAPSKKAVSSVVAIALSLLLLPSPALAGDGGLGLSASETSPLANGLLPAHESADASSSASAGAVSSADGIPAADDAASPNQADSLSSELTPASVTRFTADITIGGTPCPCMFTATGATTVKLGDGVNPAVALSVAGAVQLPLTVTNPADGGSYTVTKIGAYAFKGCKGITSTGLGDPKSTIVEIGDSAFQGCSSLTDTGLGANESLADIEGADVFENCSSLADTGLGINDHLDSLTGRGIFTGCTSLATTGLSTNQTLQVLGSETFSGCTKLTDTGLASNTTLTSCGDLVFAQCPDLCHAAAGVASFGATTFESDDALTDICCYGAPPSADNGWLKQVDANDKKITVYYLSEQPGWANLPANQIVREDDSLKALSRLKIVGGSAKTPSQCYWATLPDTASADRYAQGDQIPTSLAVADDFMKWYSDDSTGSFDDKKTTSPVYTMGASAGKDTTTLNALTSHFSSSIQANGKPCNCDFKVTGDTMAEITPGIDHLLNGSYTAIDAATTGDLAIPDSVVYGGDTYAVTRIDDRSFAGCTHITSAGLASNTSITEIGQNAFRNCSSLSDTGLGSNASVQALDYGVFYGCSSLASTGLGLNASVSSLGVGVFFNCTSLTDTGLAANKTLVSLGSGDTFNGCQALIDTGLASNSTLTMLSPNAFTNCSQLKNTGLALNKTLTTINDQAFCNCPALTDTGLATNTKVTSLGTAVFRNCTSLVHAAIGESVASLSDNCFDGDSALADVCFYGKWVPSGASWLGNPSNASLAIYYLAWHASWAGKTASDVARPVDLLIALSHLSVNGGIASTSPSSYWATVPGASTEGCYTQGADVSVAATGDDFLRWMSDDQTGHFAHPSEASTVYTVGVPASGTMKLTALSRNFSGTIQIDGKNAPCTYVIDGNGTVQVGDGFKAAIDRSTTGNLVLPTTVAYGDAIYAIDRIADAAFENCSGITSTGLTSNTSIKSVGANAFKGCTGITSTGLSSGSAVDSVGPGAFSGCTALTETGLAGNTGLTAIASGVFQGCTKLVSTGLAENNRIASIGSNAFEGCSVLDDTGLASNSTVTSIGDGSFAHTGLSNIAIGSAVTSFGTDCFDGDDVVSICFFGNAAPSDSSWLGVRKNAKNPITLYYLAENAGWSGRTAAALTGGADDSLRALSHLTVDAGSSLSTASSYWAHLQGSATEGRYAQGEKVPIDVSDPSAFLRWKSDDASGLFADPSAAATDYVVGAPASGGAKLTVLASRFSGTIQIGGAGKSCVYVAANDGTACIGDGSVAVDPSVSGDVALPSAVDYDGGTYAVKSIAPHAFSGCSSIDSTGLASNTSIDSIGSNAFAGCARITSTGMDSNTSITSIGDAAFADCTALIDTGLATNTSVASMGDNAFAGCTHLMHGSIGAGVTSLGKNCFDNDSQLEDICFCGLTPLVYTAWLGDACAAHLTIYYLAEHAVWAQHMSASAIRAGDSLKALSYVSTAGGRIPPSTSYYGAAKSGIVSGRYAQGDCLSIAACDPSAFFRWSSDDPSGLLADASAASTVYTVGAPTSGSALLKAAPVVVDPLVPSASNGDDPVSSKADPPEPDSQNSDPSDSNLYVDGGASDFVEPASDSTSESDAATANESALSTLTPQSTDSWSSNTSHNGDAGTSSSQSGLTRNFISIPSIAIAVVAVGAVMIAALIGLLLIRRRK